MCISLSDSMCLCHCLQSSILVISDGSDICRYALSAYQRGFTRSWPSASTAAYTELHRNTQTSTSVALHDDTLVWNIQTGWQILTKTRILRLFSLNNCHCPLPTVTKWHRWLLKIKTNYHVQTEKNKINRFGFTIPLTNSERMNEQTQQLLQSFSW